MNSFTVHYTCKVYRNPELTILTQKIDNKTYSANHMTNATLSVYCNGQSLNLSEDEWASMSSQKLGLFIICSRKTDANSP